jgi:hypothetical protein
VNSLAAGVVNELCSERFRTDQDGPFFIFKSTYFRGFTNGLWFRSSRELQLVTSSTGVSVVQQSYLRSLLGRHVEERGGEVVAGREGRRGLDVTGGRPGDAQQAHLSGCRQGGSVYHV